MSRSWFLISSIAVLAASTPALSHAAPVSAKLSAVLTAFLPDAGVKTRGLPWTTGNKLPVKWAPVSPVAADSYFRKEGFTLSRTGTAFVTVGEEPAEEVTLQLYGNSVGLQQVGVNFNYAGEPDMNSFDRSLTVDKIVLEPLKCSRKTELASEGNVIYVFKAPGKVAAALWESWNCPGSSGCTVGFTILYRRAALAKIDCYGGN